MIRFAKFLLAPLVFIGFAAEAPAALTDAINPHGRTIHAQTPTSGNFISLAGLQAVVRERGDLRTAAVLSGEASNGIRATTIEAELANDGNPAKFTIAITSGASRYSRNDAAAANGATSGTRFGFIEGTHTFTLGSTTAEKPTHFGAVFYNQATNGSANLTRVTATFNDGGTTVYNATAGARQYTFVGFAAPFGKWITSVRVDEVAGGDWLCYDDLTVVLALPDLSIDDLVVEGGTRTVERGFGKSGSFEFTLRSEADDAGFWKIVWEGSQPGWANIEPAAGRIAAGTTETLRATTDAAGLPPGNRVARFAVVPESSAAAAVPEAAWQTLGLTVREPEFTPDSATLDVPALVGFAGEQRIDLVPATPGRIALTGVSSSAAWLRPYLSENSHNDVRVAFNLSGLAVGTHSATIFVESEGTIQAVAVNLTIAAQRVVKLHTDPRRNRVFALHQPLTGNGRLLTLDGSTRAITHSLPLGAKPTDLDLTADGSRLYVAHANGDFRVFDPDAMTEITRHDLSGTGAWSLFYDSNVSAGPGNIAFITDGSWAPQIHVVDTTTGVILQSALTGPANNPGDTGCGDLVYHPQRHELFTWNQYGWTAGSSRTSISRFAVDVDGRLTLNGRSEPSNSPPNFRREPLETPILLSADGKVLVAKNRWIDMDDLGVSPAIYPQEIYAMTRTGGAVFAENAGYVGGGGNQVVMNLPVATRVQTVAPDGKRLFYFNPGSARVESITIEGAFNTRNLGISRIPDGTVARQNGQTIRWEPVPGAREYRIYFADDMDALAPGAPDPSLLVGTSHEHWFVVDWELPALTRPYYRVDAWTNRGVVEGQRRPLFVGRHDVDREELRFKTVAGTDGRGERLTITSSSPMDWTIVANASWLRFSANSGTTPATVEVIANATNLSPGLYTAEVSVRDGSASLVLPVELTVRPRNFTRVISDPDRPQLYVLNSVPNDHAQGAFVMRFDTTAERFDRVIQVPHDIRATALHRGDGKIYLGYGFSGESSSIASVDVPGLTSVSPPVKVPAMDENIAFFSHWEWIIPGPPGLLVADKRWEYLLDTADFSLVANAPRESRVAAFHPSGVDYYAGFNGSRGPIRKYRIENSSFVETVSRQLSLIGNSPLDNSLLVSTDGSRVSWSRTIMDEDLNELIALPEPIFTLTHGGELAATANRIFNARTGMEIGPLPINSSFQGMGSDRMKLFQFQAATWQGTNLFDITALPVDGAITTVPAEGAMVVGPSQTLSWTGVPTALEYRVFFGADAAAVAAAGPDDPEFLGATTGFSIEAPSGLVPGAQYHWRIEMVGYQSTVSSTVRSFVVAPIDATPIAVSLNVPAGVPIPDVQTVALVSPTPLAWTASTSTPWLQVVTTGGTTPDPLRFTVQTAGLPTGTHQGAITLATEGFPEWQIPVTLVLDPANITETLLDPVTERLYGISQNANAVVGNNNVLHPAHLVVYDRATGQPQRSVPVGTSVSQIVIHEAENRLYIANWKSGHLRALDRDTLEEVALFPFTPYNTVFLAVGDVYAIAPGPAGRMVMGKGPSGSSGPGPALLLVDTDTGEVVAQSMSGFRPGRMIDEPSGNAIQFFTQAGGQSPASRLGITGDVFAKLKEVSQPAITFAGIQPAFRDLNGTRYFAANAVFDEDLNLLRTFAQGQNARSISLSGDVMITSNRVQNVVTGMEIANLPITTNVMALDDENDRLFLFPANQIVPTAVDFAALADLPPGDLTPGTPDGKTIIGATLQLDWTADRRAFSYQVYFGTDAAAVAAAGPNDPEFLGETSESSLPAPEPLDYDAEYFWRVDATGRNGTRAGSVWSFRVAPIDIEPRVATIHHPRGVPTTTRSVAILAGDDAPEWTAATSTPWISLVTTSGVAPGVLEFDIDPDGLAIATHSGAIRITSGGREFDLPVSLTMHALNYVMLASDPDKPLNYAISRPDSLGSRDPSFLVVMDAHADEPLFAVEVGWGITDLTIHEEEDRIYLVNYAAGQLRALDRNTFEEVVFRQFPQPGIPGPEVIHGLAPGREGRIALTQIHNFSPGSQLRLADTDSGDLVASIPISHGVARFDPTKRWLYYGVTATSTYPIIKYDTANDELVQVAASSQSAYATRQLMIDETGERVFWGHHMFDADLNSLWTFTGPVLGLGAHRAAMIDPTGEWLLTFPQSGSGMIWNTRERRSVFDLSGFSWGTDLSYYSRFAFNRQTGRFHHAASNLTHSFAIGPLLPPGTHPAGVQWLTFGQNRWAAAPDQGDGVLATTVTQRNEASLLSISVPHAATVSFEWKLDTDNTFNSLNVFGIQGLTGAGTINERNQWIARSVTIPAGGGWMTWRAFRSQIASTPATAYVRNITITPLAQPAAAMVAEGIAAEPAGLIAWATGAEPGKAPHFTLLPDGDGGMRVEFDRRHAAGDVPRVTLESSSDLREWSPVDEAAMQAEEIRNGIERVRLWMPRDHARRFLRLRVDAPEQP